MSLQSAMERTSPNELKMSTGKVEDKHWSIIYLKINNGRLVKRGKRFHWETALRRAEANTSKRQTVPLGQRQLNDL